MKTINAIIISISVLFSQYLFAEEYDMSDLNEKIQSVIDANLHKTNTAIDVSNLLNSQEFASLRQKCEIDWQQIADVVEQVENGDIGIRLVFLAMSYMPPLNYMTVIESSVLKYQNDLLSEKALINLIFNEGHMGAFVIDNYNHPRIVAVLNTIKEKTNDNNFKQRIIGVINGNAKAALDDYREGHEGLAEGNIPIVILPN